MVQVIQLCSVSFNTEQLSNQAQFYTDRWGLEPVEEHGGQIYFRAEGSRHHVLSLHESAGNKGLRSITLALAPGTDLDRAHDELLQAGVEVVSGPTNDFAPGIERGLVVKDVDGRHVELVLGVAETRTPYGNRDVKPQDVNHVVLESPDPDALESFYTNKLGFRMTEKTPGIISFYRCNANHHSIAITKSQTDGVPTLNHVAFELRDWEAWARALYFAGERGITRVAGPGRHGPGNNLFAYYRDEELNTIEYTTEVEQVDANNPPIFHRPEDHVGNQWQTSDGHW